MHTMLWKHGIWKFYVEFNIKITLFSFTEKNSDKIILRSIKLYGTLLPFKKLIDTYKLQLVEVAYFKTM